MTVLVIGASGQLGRAVAIDLAARGISVRAMTRRADATRPDGVDELVRADLHDPASLDAACAGVERMFLVSSPTAEQIMLETNAIVAAEGAGVEQIVKISNIPIAGLETGLHRNHRAIERRLADTSMVATVLQPSFFNSVLGRQLGLLRQGRLVFPTGKGRIGWIDPRDIAAVAASLLAEPEPRAGALRLTGPEALSATDLGARISDVTGRAIEVVQPPLDVWQKELIAGGMDPWLVVSTLHLYEAIARGALDDLSSDVERVLGRPPRPIDDWLRDELVPLLGE